MNIELPTIELSHWAPFLIVLVMACVVLLADLYLRREWALKLLPAASILGCLLSFWALFTLLPVDRPGGLALFEKYQVFLITPFSRGCMGVILIGAALLLMLSQRTVEQRQLPLGEYYGLFMFAVAGMIMMAASVELLTLFINLEIVSIAIYILVGIERRNQRAGEAALKYFVLGAFASAFLIFGAAFFYGYARTTFLADVPTGIDPTIFSRAGPFFALALILAGFAFKLTLAPFHLYAADVYDGAPTPVAALLATGVKVAGFCALTQMILLLKEWYPLLGQAAASALLFLALISIIVGNAVALTMRRIKRLLAYSSIAHSGYLLLGVVILVGVLETPETAGQTNDIVNAIVTYLLAYTLMNVLAFGVVASLGERFKGEIDNYAGLARQQPFMAAAMAVAMVALTGLPPTVGFIGKLYVFAEVVKTEYLYAAVIAVLASVMSAFYYLRVVVKMYMVEPELELRGERPLANDMALGLCLILIFAFGAVPYLLIWLY